MFGPCFVINYLGSFLVLQSSIILLMKRRLHALLYSYLCSCCRVVIIVLCLFLIVPRVGPQGPVQLNNMPSLIIY